MLSKKRKLPDDEKTNTPLKKQKQLNKDKLIKLIEEIEKIQKKIYVEIGRIPKMSISRIMTQKNLTIPYINFLKVDQQFDSKKDYFTKKSEYFPYFEKLLQNLLNVEFKKATDKDRFGFVFKNLTDLHQHFKEEIVQFEKYICSINERYKAKVISDEFSNKLKGANTYKKFFLAKKHGIKFFADQSAGLIRPSAKKKARKPSSRVPK